VLARGLTYKKNTLFNQEKDLPILLIIVMF